MPKRTNHQFKWADGKTVSQKQLADMLGVTVRQVRRYLQDTESPKDSLAEFVKWRFLKDIGIEMADGEIPENADAKKLTLLKLYHDTRKAKAEANRSELGEEKERFDLDVHKGVYVLREIIEVNLSNVSKALSDLLFAFPERVVSRVIGETDEREIVTLMESELRTITEEIDEWEILPDA